MKPHKLREILNWTPDRNIHVHKQIRQMLNETLYELSHCALILIILKFNLKNYVECTYQPKKGIQCNPNSNKILFRNSFCVRGGTKMIFELGWIGIHVPLSTKTMQRTKRNYTAINTFDKSQISGPIELFDFTATKKSLLLS